MECAVKESYLEEIYGYIIQHQRYIMYPLILFYAPAK